LDKEDPNVEKMNEKTLQKDSSDHSGYKFKAKKEQGFKIGDKSDTFIYDFDYLVIDENIALLAFVSNNCYFLYILKNGEIKLLRNEKIVFGNTQVT
jgi:hypothetical protein